MVILVECMPKFLASCLLQNTVFISGSHQNSKKRRDRKGREGERKRRERRGEKGKEDQYFLKCSPKIKGDKIFGFPSRNAFIFTDIC